MLGEFGFRFSRVHSAVLRSLAQYRSHGLPVHSLNLLGPPKHNSISSSDFQHVLSKNSLPESRHSDYDQNHSLGSEVHQYALTLSFLLQVCTSLFNKRFSRSETSLVRRSCSAKDWFFAFRDWTFSVCKFAISRRIWSKVISRCGPFDTL